MDSLLSNLHRSMPLITESFLNSPEFTSLRVDSSCELRLGILGSSISGKSDLVHRYLTGEYAKVDSFTGRHKKEICFDGQSHLLLIRNETGPPDLQFTQWVDAVIFVFSLDDELSFSVLSGYFAKMAQYRKYISDVPVVLVSINDDPTHIEQSGLVATPRIKKLITELKQCVYIEASAQTGENVDLVFNTAIAKLIQARGETSPVLTSFDPLHSPTYKDPPDQQQANALSQSPIQSGANSASSTPSSSTKRSSRRRTMLFSSSKDKKEKEVVPDTDVGSGRSIPIRQGYLLKRSSSSINKEWKKKYVTLLQGGLLAYYPNLHDYMDDVHQKTITLKHTTVKVPGKRPPKASTPVQGNSRPTTPTESENSGSIDSLAMSSSEGVQNGVESNSSYNSLPLQTDIDNALASMGHVLPLGSTNASSNAKTDGGVVKKKNKRSKHTKSCEIDVEDLEKAFAIAAANAIVPSGPKVDQLSVNSGSTKKKGHRRVKSGSGAKVDLDPEMTDWEFTIVSLEAKTWQFAAASQEERDTWVQLIEQQILSCLQSNESGREKVRGNSSSSSNGFDLQAIRSTDGNDVCVDCGAPNPDWASLNLGALMCIECSGMHRNLGSHVSRVRSLDLDEWPSELTAVMCAIGNARANSVWEGKIQNKTKPSPSSSREEKEKWVRAKYEAKEFLQDLPPCDFPLGEQLLEAVMREDLPQCILLLPRCSPEDLNAINEDRGSLTPLQISCSLGNIVITQLLIWYFADVRILDGKGRSALWHAKSAGSKECADILRHNGCNDLGTLIPQVYDVFM
ncbi:arf-GAP with GTPase, ANK repeat and PH domain-containing protein 1-like isoform X2 [Acropora millepora]|uniref:arf-GAP with GTPase, ANK repeat and PH domain-containing protein 1-like isoform X2 n=1 Tax=Acropora millepora TaxID=45264 RepID=UPI001CF2D294|nr:arf-GAP with GTPase, ANK repeat and PH domain-containing protein 1-like isoform X2 [Acropora millepora]